MSRNVVVTGGGTGIGKEIARRFADAGDEVYIIGRRANVLEDAARELGDGVLPVVCDLSDPEAVTAATDRLPARVDVLVNNAGGRDREDRGAGLSAVCARWQSDFERNVLTKVLITEALTGRLTAPGGRIVTIGSVAALRGNDSYGAAKAALHAWNHTLATTLGKRGITANVVVSGFVAGTEFFGVLPQDELDRRAKATLVGQVGTPADIAAAVVFLASAGAGYITGELLNCNGGVLLGR